MPAPSAPPSGQETQRSKLVLIVEDDPRAAQWLAILTQQVGHKPVTALNGDAALDLVRRARPDVIFVDLVLPDIEGHDLIRELRAMSGMEGVKIFVVSAHGDADSISASHAAGAIEHFVKPMRLADLKRVLDS
jgi:DNA-binding response OmpR family regulator